MTAPSKAAVTRWFDDHVGCTIDTQQVSPLGARTWSPGLRTLVKGRKATWTLDGSEVRLTSTHKPVLVTSDQVVLDWVDERGYLIHTTTYSVA